MKKRGVAWLHSSCVYTPNPSMVTKHVGNHPMERTFLLTLEFLDTVRVL